MNQLQNLFYVGIEANENKKKIITMTNKYLHVFLVQKLLIVFSFKQKKK